MADHFCIEVGSFASEAAALACRNLLRGQSLLARQRNAEVLVADDGRAWRVLLRLSATDSIRLMDELREGGGTGAVFAGFVRLANASNPVGALEELLVAELAVEIDPRLRHPNSYSRRNYRDVLDRGYSEWDGSAGRAGRLLDEGPDEEGRPDVEPGAEVPRG